MIHESRIVNPMVRLEPISLVHAAEVQELASDARIADTSNVPHPYPIDGAATWIRYTTAQREQGRELNFAIVAVDPVTALGAGPSTSLRAGPSTSPRAGRVVGVCGVLNIGGVPRSGELGYWVGVPYWGRGYATAGASQLVKIVFEEHGVERLYSSCLVRNPASFRVLQKAGFRHVGYGTHPNTKWGPEDRFALFELMREEWRAAGRPSQTRTT
jgi:RimJ/RimL family protein N-acetyltransferase